MQQIGNPGKCLCRYEFLNFKVTNMNPNLDMKILSVLNCEFLGNFDQFDEIYNLKLLLGTVVVCGWVIMKKVIKFLQQIST